MLKTLGLLVAGFGLMIAALVVAFLEPITTARIAVDWAIYLAGAILLSCALYQILDRLLHSMFPARRNRLKHTRLKTASPARERTGR